MTEHFHNVKFSIFSEKSYSWMFVPHLFNATPQTCGNLFCTKEKYIFAMHHHTDLHKMSPALVFFCLMSPFLISFPPFLEISNSDVKGT